MMHVSFGSYFIPLFYDVAPRFYDEWPLLTGEKTSLLIFQHVYLM